MPTRPARAWLHAGGAILALALFVQAAPLQAQAPAGRAPGQELVPFEVLFLQGNLARSRGDIATADRMFQAAARSRHATPTAYIYWARMHRERGDLNRAATILQLGSRRFPEDAPIALEQAYLALAAEDWAAVSTALTRVGEQAANNPFAAYLHGQLARQRGDLETARRQFEQAAAQRHVHQLESLHALAEVGMALGNRPLAATTLRRAIELTRSPEDRNALEARIDELERSSNRVAFSLRGMGGIHGDSNVNLAPRLFPDSQLAAVRAAVGLSPRLAINGTHLDGGVRLLGHQSLHWGETGVEDYNAGLLSAEGTVRWRRAGHRLGMSLGYDSTFLPMRDPGMRHFSERIHGGPLWRWQGERWGWRTRLLGERSLYYADNRSGPDDRRSAGIDWIAQFGPDLRLDGRNRINLDLGLGTWDAHGDNYDVLGWNAGLRYAWTGEQWAASAGTRYENRHYPNHRESREDRILAADLGGQRLFPGGQALGMVLAWERNAAAGAGGWGWERVIAGLSWQGRLWPWGPM